MFSGWRPLLLYFISLRLLFKISAPEINKYFFNFPVHWLVFLSLSKYFWSVNSILCISFSHFVSIHLRMKGKEERNFPTHSGNKTSRFHKVSKKHWKTKSQEWMWIILCGLEWDICIDKLVFLQLTSVRKCWNFTYNKNVLQFKGTHS